MSVARAGVFSTNGNLIIINIDVGIILIIRTVDGFLVESISYTNGFQSYSNLKRNMVIS
jgi:hypothetical protein